MKYRLGNELHDSPKLLRLPKKDALVWRYMSLSKFLDLLARRSLFLGQLALLQSEDPFEGSLAADRLEYLQKVISDDDVARRELAIPPDQPIPAQIRAAYNPATTAWQNQRAVERTYVNCWHINPVESANLWSVYAAQGEGIAIQSTVGSLKAALGQNVRKLTLAPVRYIDHRSFRMGPSIEEAVFYKRLSYKSEKELRIRFLLPFEDCVVEQNDKRHWQPPAGIHFSINCNKLIEKIYISPSLVSGSEKPSRIYY